MKAKTNEKHVSPGHDSRVSVLLDGELQRGAGQGKGTRLVHRQQADGAATAIKPDRKNDSHGQVRKQLQQMRGEEVQVERLDRFSRHKTFDHAAAAERLKSLHTDAQNGLRRVVAFGLFCYELKEIHLKHGQFGPWLQVVAPDYCKLHSVSKIPQPSSTLDSFMRLTKSALESCGLSIRGVLGKLNPQQLGISYSGEIFLLADVDVPVSVKKLHAKICAVVDGKTQRSLFSEFKQSEEEGKVKLGPLKGRGGASKAQRVDAAELERQERITERTLKAQEVAEWLLEMSDDKGFGELFGTKELIDLDIAMETARSFIRNGGAK